MTNIGIASMINDRELIAEKVLIWGHNISGIENSGGKQAGKINKGMENDKHPEIAGRCIYCTE